jgi:hypothetical protein
MPNTRHRQCRRIAAANRALSGTSRNW